MKTKTVVMLILCLEALGCVCSSDRHGVSMLMHKLTRLRIILGPVPAEAREARDRAVIEAFQAVASAVGFNVQHYSNADGSEQWSGLPSGEVPSDLTVCLYLEVESAPVPSMIVIRTENPPEGYPEWEDRILALLVQELEKRGFRSTEDGFAYTIDRT